MLTESKVRYLLNDNETERDFIDHILGIFEGNRFVSEQLIACCREETLNMLFADSLVDRDFAGAIVKALKESKKENEKDTVDVQ